MWRAGLLIVASLATVAHADDPRDVFGFGKKRRPAPPPPLDCSDGSEFGCADATDPLAEDESPYGLATWLPASYLLRLPVADATHDQVAHYALGASRDEAGPAFGGATGLENRWTIEGAPADGLRTGAADARIPLLFLEGIRVNAGGFTARERVSTGGTVDARLRRGTRSHVVELRGWSGNSLRARKRPIAPRTYFVRRGSVDPGPHATVAAVATGPLPRGAWYAAGVATELTSTRFTWTASTVRDADGDGVEDGLPGVVATDRIAVERRAPLTLRVPLMLRAGIEQGVHQADVTLLGTVATDTRYLYNATLQAAGVDGISGVGDAIATWRGTWQRTHARAQLAWHRAMRRESASDPLASNIPQVLSAYVPEMLPEDPAVERACSDDPARDPYPHVANCPVPIGWFASGGAGPLTAVTGDRPSFTADLAHRLGHSNVLRVGVTGEDTRLVTRTRFTGSAQVRSLFPGHLSERRFVDPGQICNADATLPCPTVEEAELRWRTRYTAAYVENTWRAAPDIKVDAGVRWELMWVGPVLHFSDQLAPRMGVSWDPLGGGRSRVWTSMGRSYAYLPAGLGATILQRERTVDRITSMFGEGRAVDTGAVVPVAADVQPIAQDELTAGVQLALARTVRGTVWTQGRWLRRGLDTTRHGFDNPGRFGGTPATRETAVVAAELATAPTARLVLRAGYMYGRTIGSWTGAFDPRQGAVLYAGSDYDATSVNLLGRLPTDMGHRTYVEAERRTTVGAVELAIAMRLTTGSGRPRSAIADSQDGIIYLIPRGSAGRGPMLTQANLRMGARWRSIDVTLDVFNAFHRRAATAVDEVYAVGAVRPIDRGTREDLVFLKHESGADSARRATYQSATAYQAPLSAVLGIRHVF